jgi:nucleotide-binding universal stress UspA family protein
MLDEILVPLDGSAVAECVLAHVIILAQVFGSQVTLLHVLAASGSPEKAQVDPLDWHLRKAEAQAYIEEVSGRLRQADVRPNTALLEGPAAERIIEYAHEHDVDLLVLSSHGRSGLSGWNVSSVVQKVIQRVNKSTMVVRAYRPGNDVDGIRYRRILVPLDGSQRAECVLPVATKLAQQHQAELLLAHVVTRPEVFRQTPLTAEDNELIDQLIERNQAAASKYFEQLRSRLSIEVETRLFVSNNITTTLHNLVEEEEIDLVLLTAHGRSAEKLRPYGSLATSFITYGTKPLLIIQDLPPKEIEPTQAEIAVQTDTNGSVKRMHIYDESSAE